MSLSAAIEVDHLTKIYKGSGTPAVDDISFTIPNSSIFGLLGPNGAGKTTTISVLCGLLSASTGKVTIAGLSAETQSSEIKKIIGVVPQDIALYPTLTAFENLRYIGNMYGLKGDSLKENINKHLDHFGLSQHAKKQVGSFSGGMKRRVNLIAGILHQPEILFLDEPTVGVDVQSRNVITEHLQVLNKGGMTIIYTSHLMEEAENLCTEIAIIDNGKIIAKGMPKVLIKENGSANLEQMFLKLTGKRLRD
ncbi:MAG: ABC-type multidrug transport system, ATPase component [Bacteroidota bacterium]|jgi:ABC-2 type transport system ATP-binding protein|nr:ABC-type multidrug transport system, ATPase component [Bacteroidota bacterium]